MSSEKTVKLKWSIKGWIGRSSTPSAFGVFFTVNALYYLLTYLLTYLLRTIWRPLWCCHCDYVVFVLCDKGGVETEKAATNAVAVRLGTAAKTALERLKGSQQRDRSSCPVTRQVELPYIVHTFSHYIVCLL